MLSSIVAVLLAVIQIEATLLVSLLGSVAIVNTCILYPPSHCPPSVPPCLTRHLPCIVQNRTRHVALLQGNGNNDWPRLRTVDRGYP